MKRRDTDDLLLGVAVVVLCFALYRTFKPAARPGATPDTAAPSLGNVAGSWVPPEVDNDFPGSWVPPIEGNGQGIWIPPAPEVRQGADGGYYVKSMNTVLDEMLRG